jgi:NADH dehydrogenase (ubiquinone) 1 alpha subcomplex subunit 6
MYSLNMPVARIRSKMREEFEKHRYVNNIQAVDVLIAQSDMEFQVCGLPFIVWEPCRAGTDKHIQETLNFWKQKSHVMKYFRKEEDPNAYLPKNFMQGFLEVWHPLSDTVSNLTRISRDAIDPVPSEDF